MAKSTDPKPTKGVLAVREVRKRMAKMNSAQRRVLDEGVKHFLKTNKIPKDLNTRLVAAGKNAKS